MPQPEPREIFGLASPWKSDPPLWELYSDWFGPLQRLADDFGLNRFDDDEKNDAETSEFPGLKTTEGEYFSDLLQALRYACEGFEDCRFRSQER